MIRHTNFHRTANAIKIASFVTGAFLVNAANAAPIAAPTPKPKPKAVATPKPTPKPAATPKPVTPSSTAPVTAPVAAAASTPVAASSVSAAEAVAMVNGEAILKKDVERLLKVAIARSKNLQGDSDEAKKKVADARQQIVTDRIDLALWTQEAKRRKVMPAKADIDKTVAQNKTAFRDNASWVKFLNGRSEADYRRTVSQEMAVTELFTRLTADIKVSDEDIKTYYDANRDKFKAPEMVRVHHIFFISPNSASATEQERVLNQANEVLKRAQAPNANFEALARENSQADDVMDDSGGLPLFWRDRIPLPKEFQDAAFAAETGQIVGPVKTEMGLHIIKIDEKVPSGPAPLTNSLKNDIRFALTTQKNDALLKTTLNDLKTKADIVIK